MPGRTRCLTRSGTLFKIRTQVSANYSIALHFGHNALKRRLYSPLWANHKKAMDSIKAESNAAMILQKLLIKDKKALLNRWFDLIIESYPPETSQFLKNQKDRFQNPVGFTISKEIEAIFDQLVGGKPQKKMVSEFLDKIIRIRAVQDFSPSDAVSFMFQLKAIVREEVQKQGKEAEQAQLSKELLEFERAIDRLALLAFDIYVSCRQKVFEIKADEMKRHYANILKRSGGFCETVES